MIRDVPFQLTRVEDGWLGTCEPLGLELQEPDKSELITRIENILDSMQAELRQREQPDVVVEGTWTFEKLTKFGNWYRENLLGATSKVAPNNKEEKQ